ncbi:MAG: hypothetical protein Q9160_003389 [Pyrenula sp. 1 TL-2023]
MGSSTVYDHVPLGSSDTTIRLLELTNSTPQDRICGKLVVFDIEECPSYTALSYTWGPPISNHGIWIDELYIPVRENLWHFLQRTQAKPRWRYLWIDAVCINQASISEKSHQVRLMGDIFSKAALVALWLGPEADGSDMAIRFLSSLHTHYQLDPNSPETKTLLERFSQRSWAASEAIAILKLYNRSYWSRIWTVQEVLLANTIIVVCGDLGLGWDCFTFPRTMTASWEEINLSTYFMAAILFSAAAVTVMNRDAWQAGIDYPPRRLERLLSAFYRMDACDRRDKVFALLALVNTRAARAQSTSALQANYSMSMIQVYAEVLRECFFRRSLTEFDETPWGRYQATLRSSHNLTEETLKLADESSWFEFAAKLQISLDLTKETPKVAEIVRLYVPMDSASLLECLDKDPGTLDVESEIQHEKQMERCQMQTFYDETVGRGFECSDHAVQSIRDTYSCLRQTRRLKRQAKCLKLAVHALNQSSPSDERNPMVRADHNEHPKVVYDLSQNTVIS